MSADRFLALALAVVMILAAVVRFDVARLPTELRWWYRLSVPMAVFYAVYYVWVLLGDETDLLMTVRRSVAVPWCVVVAIVPPVVTMRRFARSKGGE